MSLQPNIEATSGEGQGLTGVPVVSHIFTPGSSLHPTFLLIVDSIFASLLVVLGLLAFITSGNLHFFVLISITLALWASVKWYVLELKQTALEDKSQGDRSNSVTEEARKSE